jgi:hypothetical protein
MALLNAARDLFSSNAVSGPGSASAYRLCSGASGLRNAAGVLGPRH